MDNLQSKMYSAFDVDPAPIRRFIQWLAKSYGLPDSLAILDIGCGPGKMLVEYARMGWHITAMEPDSDFFQNARETVSQLPHIQLIEGGFCEINFREEMDFITAINNPFSYLLDVRARMLGLEQAYRALKPGGIIFLEITNFLHRLQHYQPYLRQDKNVDGETITHIMENFVDVEQARWLLRDLYKVEGKPDVVVKYHEQAVITLPELSYLLEQQGFTNIRTYTDYENLAPGPSSGQNILISAQKPR